MKTIAWTFAGGVLVTATAKNIADTEWAAYLKSVAENLPVITSRNEIRALAWAAGPGGPNAKQRKLIAAILHEKGLTMRGAVMTNDPLSRGVVTAMRWLFRPELIAVAHDEFDAGADHLGLTDTQRSEVQSALTRVRSELAGSLKIGSA